MILNQSMQILLTSRHFNILKPALQIQYDNILQCNDTVLNGTKHKTYLNGRIMQHQSPLYYKTIRIHY